MSTRIHYKPKNARCPIAKDGQHEWKATPEQKSVGSILPHVRHENQYCVWCDDGRCLWIEDTSQS